MKDMFGREMNVGDVVVYATRSGSTQHMMVAKVLRMTDNGARVQVIAGNGYDWRVGHTVFNKETRDYEWVPMEGYEATLRTSNNVMIANGIDADGMHALLMESQRKEQLRRTV
jgi:hypothetical protein